MKRAMISIVGHVEGSYHHLPQITDLLDRLIGDLTERAEIQGDYVQYPISRIIRNEYGEIVVNLTEMEA